MPPIKLKGISREIIPYAVEEILQEKLGNDTAIIETHSDNSKLYLELDAMDTSEQKEIEKALQSTLSSVQALSK